MENKMKMPANYNVKIAAALNIRHFIFRHHGAVCGHLQFVLHS